MDDEHSLLLPACDGMTADERTEQMIEAMSDWTFLLDEECHDRVMLCDE